MNRRIIYILLVSLHLSVFSYAQILRTQVISGIEYYQYSVQQGEGLWRISQNFGVSQEEIIRINPEIAGGLRAGQVILIPRSNQASAEDANFILHRVERQQTLFSLSRQYGVSQEEIIRLNPEVAGGLRYGETIRIPRAGTAAVAQTTAPATTPTPTTPNANYIIHRVEARETLFSISRKYNVQIEDIQRLNPDLEVLSIGRELRIPTQAATIAATQTTNVPAATPATERRPSRFANVDWGRLFQQRSDTESAEKVRIAFLLPFSLENRSNPDLRFLEFYAGAVLAIAEARARGLSLDIYAFDSGETAERMADVFFQQQQVLSEVDLIVGPAFPSQVPVAMQFAQTNRVKTLIPLTNRIHGIENNPWIFQFNPPVEAELNLLRETLNTRFAQSNIIFVELPNVPETNEGIAISRQIQSILTEQGRSFRVVVPTLAQDDHSIEQHLVRGRHNLIFFNTTQFQAIQPLLSNLNAAARSHDITLFERFAWKVQETQRPPGVYIAPFRAERSILLLNDFNLRFKNLFGWEASMYHPRFDLLGFDLISYFINLISSESEQEILNRTHLEPNQGGLQSQFRFVRSSSNAGFVNQQMYVGNSQVR